MGEGGRGTTNQNVMFCSQLHTKCFSHQHIADNHVTSLKKVPCRYSLKGKNWLWGKWDRHAPTKAEIALANITPNNKLEVRVALLSTDSNGPRRGLKNLHVPKNQCWGVCKGDNCTPRPPPTPASTTDYYSGSTPAADPLFPPLLELRRTLHKLVPYSMMLTSPPQALHQSSFFTRFFELTWVSLKGPRRQNTAVCFERTSLW